MNYVDMFLPPDARASKYDHRVFCVRKDGLLHQKIEVLMVQAISYDYTKGMFTCTVNDGRTVLFFDVKNDWSTAQYSEDVTYYLRLAPTGWIEFSGPNSWAPGRFRTTPLNAESHFSKIVHVPTDNWQYLDRGDAPEDITIKPHSLGFWWESSLLEDAPIVTAVVFDGIDGRSRIMSMDTFQREYPQSVSDTLPRVYVTIKDGQITSRVRCHTRGDDGAMKL